jgi:hypothetical protein
MPTLGLGDRCYFLDVGGAVGITPQVSPYPVDLEHSRAVSLILVAKNGSIDGAWLIEASNDYAPGDVRQRTTPGTWVDVTALFKRPDGTAIAAVAHGTAATTAQYAQAALLAARCIRATFTGSAGGDATTVIQAILAGGEY